MLSKRVVILSPQTYEKTLAQVTRSRYFHLILLTALSVSLIRCANPVSPSGGPKDENPPQVTGCDPPSYTRNFTGNSIRIDLNEFITLKNPSGEIFFSPPLKRVPDPRLRGKSIILGWNDTLRQNTTYNINFGNAITDLTEGNTLKGFSYVFSTGPYIDSLSLEGEVVTAFNLKPVKEVFIGLYTLLQDTMPVDSLPLRVPPYYLTRADDNGNFSLRNLGTGPYMIFALADMNSDLIFNQFSERIAFLDSLVTPAYHPVPKPSDSLPEPDSTVMAHDSLNTIQVKKQRYTLRMFEQPDTVQRLIRYGYKHFRKIDLVFRLPVADLKITPLNFDSLSRWNMIEYSPQADTLALWLTGKVTDSLTLKIQARNMPADTLELTHERVEQRGRKEETVKTEFLTLVKPSAGFSLNQFRDSLKLVWSSPILHGELSGILLTDGKDTLPASASFLDSIRRTMYISHPWKEDCSYTVIIPDSVFTGLTGIQKDSVILSFRTRAERDFGNLLLKADLSDMDGQYLIQLLSEQEDKLFEQQVLNKGGELHFRYLVPGKYKIKAIRDRNRNFRWDTGNYYRSLQPEEVLYFPGTIEIRANWDVEEKWD